MTLAYLDSSAFAKLYLIEVGAERVEALIEATGRVAACAITYAEVRSVLARAFHDGHLTEEEHPGAAGTFEADWETTNVVDVTPGLLRLSGDLLKGDAGLRAMDALQLAAALGARAVEDLRFLTFDADLDRVALRLMPEASP